MKIFNLFTGEEDSFISGKADFILACMQKNEQDIFSQDSSQITLNATPSPIVITKAINNLLPFHSTEVLDLSYLKELSSKSIFQEGMKHGVRYELRGNFLILAGDFSDNKFTNEKTTTFEELDSFSDKRLIYYAGFVVEASRRFHIVLSGRLEMVFCLLIAENLREKTLMRIKHANVTIATVAFTQNDTFKEMLKPLSRLSYQPHAVYTTFSFQKTEIDSLKAYNQGNVKDDFGTGATLCQAINNSLTNQELLDAIELIIYSS